MMASFDAPVPLSELESVLSWVDGFKLSRRPSKKINRDFSDAVLLAEILSIHYPKLVEMHNYPPRNSHALKLNNWMTLNKKVLKKLKLSLCHNTMDQLANCAPGLIERVLIMVRDKIRKDEELNKSTMDNEQNNSSGGSYYEACGDDEHVLVVPVKTRVSGVLETVQQKVIMYEAFLSLKEELRDAKDTVELLKQKVDHLDSMVKLKDERIDELQKQLDRKASRRKESESVTLPTDNSAQITPKPSEQLSAISKTSCIKFVESFPSIKTAKSEEIKFESRIPIPIDDVPIPKIIEVMPKLSANRVDFKGDFTKSDTSLQRPKSKEVVSKTSMIDIMETASKDKELRVTSNDRLEVERVKSDVFEEAVTVDDSNTEHFNNMIITIEKSIFNEIKGISESIEMAAPSVN